MISKAKSSVKDDIFENLVLKNGLKVREKVF